MVRGVIQLPLVYRSYVWYSPGAEADLGALPPPAHGGARRTRGGARRARHEGARPRGPRRSHRPAARRADEERRGNGMTDAAVAPEARATDGEGPLAGVRVVELGQLLAGPFTGRLLGDMGAEIIKVEAPGQPDPIREWGKARYQGRSLWWPVQSRNKKCVTLNLRAERGQQLLLELVEAGRRPHRELPPRDARALERRLGAAQRGEPEARPRPDLRLRPDRPVCRAGRLRVGRGGDGRDPLHQRLPGRAAAAHAHLARRLARRHVRGSGHPGRPLQARRARLRPGPGRRRLAARVELRDAREHGARVRPARDRPRAAGDEPEGHRALEHLQVARRQVGRHRGERGQGVRAALRGDGEARAGRPIRSSRPTWRGESTRTRSRASSATGRPSGTRPRSTRP